MKTLNFIKITVYGLLFTAILFACKKDKQPTIVGIWKGTYVNSSDNTSYPLSFNIKADESSPSIDLIVLDANGNTQGSGNWSLTGQVFEAKFSYTLEPNTILVYTATYDGQTGKLSNGTWKYELSQTNAGTWSMDKQP